MLITLVVNNTMLMETTKIVILMEPALTVQVILAVNLVMVVSSLINLDVTLLTMSARAARPIPTVLQTKPTVKMMVLAVIADWKLRQMASVPMMVLLALEATPTVIP